jgi:hypothetical protein
MPSAFPLRRIHLIPKRQHRFFVRSLGRLYNNIRERRLIKLANPNQWQPYPLAQSISQRYQKWLLEKQGLDVCNEQKSLKSWLRVIHR